MSTLDRMHIDELEEELAAFELFGYCDERDYSFSLPGFYLNEADLILKGIIFPIYRKKAKP